MDDAGSGLTVRVGQNLAGMDHQAQHPLCRGCPPVVLDQLADQAGLERVVKAGRGDLGRDQQPQAVADVASPGQGRVDGGMGQRVVYQSVQALPQPSAEGSVHSARL